MSSRMDPITSSLSPAIQNGILEILQREQNHAAALLSSSPLLSSLFVSYASRAAALESASSAPSPESEEWKSLQSAIAALREDNERLKSYNLEMTGKLGVAVASQEAFHYHASSLKEVTTSQQGDIQSLQADLVEARGKYDQLVVDSNAERAALRIQIFDLEVERGELKEAVVEQQIKISKLERQDLNRLPDLPKAATPVDTAETRELDNPECRNLVNMCTRTAEADECVEQQVKEPDENAAARETMNRAARRRVDREEAKKTEREAKERAERERKEKAEEAAQIKAEKRAEQEAKKEAKKVEREAREKAKAEREEKERLEKEKIKEEEREIAEREAAEKAKREVKEKEKDKAPVTPTPSLIPINHPRDPPPAPTSVSFGGGDKLSSSSVLGDAGGGGKSEPITMPAISGDRQPALTDAARGQKREKQRDNGQLASNLIGRSNDRSLSSLYTQDPPRPARTLAPAPQKSSGWGSWGSSLLTNIASTIAVPEPPLVNPRIEDPPRRLRPSQPPKSQPAGFGSLNKSAWSTAGWDNNPWEATKTGPTPNTQKSSTGPTQSAKPTGSTFGSRGTGQANGPGVHKNLSVDTMTEPLESNPTVAGTENIDILESTVGIRNVPALGGSGSVIADKKEAGDGALVREEAARTKDSKNPSRVSLSVREETPESQTGLTRKMVMAVSSEEDEFHWENLTRGGRRRKGRGKK